MGLGSMKGRRASIGTTQGEMVVPKFFPRKGPSGTYSHAWMSRAGGKKARQQIKCIPRKLTGDVCQILSQY